MSHYSEPFQGVCTTQCVVRELLQRFAIEAIPSAISSPRETGGRLCRLPQVLPAAAASLSVVSPSADAARQPSAFIAHSARTCFDIYMAGTTRKTQREMSQQWPPQPWSLLCQPLDVSGTTVKKQPIELIFTTFSPSIFTDKGVNDCVMACMVQTLSARRIKCQPLGVTVQRRHSENCQRAGPKDCEWFDFDNPNPTTFILC